MTDYIFYLGEYAGGSIPQDVWPDVQRDASAKVARYERIYTVTWLEPNGRDMAVCAIADAMYAFERLQAEGGAIQFELKYEDDEHDAEKAVNAYNALKDWGM